jgi:8-oxo-dGTP pyrophosphatase MutT (NUDIX family)/transcriptional regulator with XRE-family HTH domain
LLSPAIFTSRDFTSRIRDAREAKGMTQADLGRAIGSLLGRPWSRQAMSAAEKGARDFKIAELVAIAFVLETTVSQLVLPGTEVVEDHQAVTFPSGEALTTLQLIDAVLSPVRELDSERARVLAMINELAETWVDIRLAAADVDTAAARSTEVLTRLMGQVHGLVRLAPEEQPVVAAIVTSAKGVLAGNRRDGKPPWTFIAGEARIRESPEDTATREVKEEACLEVRAGRLIGERDHPVTGRHMIYLAAKPAGRSTKIAVGDDAELADVRWLSLAEADRLMPGMFGPVHDYLSSELEGTR